MKASILVAAMAAAMANQAEAMILVDEEIDRRGLVETVNGWALENQYVATVKDGQCEEVERLIAAYEGNLSENRRRRLRKKRKGVRSAKINKECFVFFEGDEETRDFVESLENVAVAEPDMLVHTDAAPPSWGLDRVDQVQKRLDNAPFSASHTGAGVNVYVIDTGINQAHHDFALPDSKSRANFGKEFASDGYKEDGNGHGTHCAGTAAGSTYGIARDSTVFGVKVLSASGSGSTSGVIQGVSWAVEHAKQHAIGKTGVLSLSLGGGKSSNMNKAVADAASAGLIVVVAAGNENQDACNVSPASAGGQAKNGGVITVGSTSSSDARSGFSNYGSCVDIWAPGTSITSAWKGGPTASNTISGTSMACPHVAGVAAILLEKHNFDKDAAQAELLAIGLQGAISDIKAGSPDLFLQVPHYVGPPTPPTPAPTSPPTFGPATLCMGSTCADFAMSTFGPELVPGQNIEGQLFATGVDEYLCDDPKSFRMSDLKDKVVLVPRGPAGGTCLFFDKVKNAENAGALAVIIHLTDKSDTIFPPAYYGSGDTRIPSMMINLRDSDKFAANHLQWISIGSGARAPTPSPAPTTGAPTTSKPTKAPTTTPDCSELNTRSCLKRQDCVNYKPKGARRASCSRRADTPPPTQSPDIFTPDGCPKANYADSQEMCSQLGMRICTEEEVEYGAEMNNKNRCRADRRFGWTNAICRGTKRVVINPRNGRSSCKSTSVTKINVRCCPE